MTDRLTDERLSRFTDDLSTEDIILDRSTVPPGIVEACVQSDKKRPTTGRIALPSPRPGKRRDPAGIAEELFAEAAAAAGPRLAALATDQQLHSIGERRHLQPLFKRRLAAAAARVDPPPAVSASLAHGLTHWWPRLGPFDISLSWAPEATVYGELKCDEDLGACAWDAVKCAFALAHGVGVGILLVAAAPASTWERKAPGTEFLVGGAWTAAEIRERHRASFSRYESDRRNPYRPVRVPARLRTAPVTSVGFQVGAAPWALAVARVRIVDDGWYDWPALVPESDPQ